MQIKKFFRYAKKAAHIGPRATFDVLKNKVQKKRFYNYWKHRAERGAANHLWETIAHKQNVSYEFPIFFDQLKKNCETFFPKSIVNGISENKNLIKHADLFADKKFDLLGSGQVNFKKNKLASRF